MTVAVRDWCGELAHKSRPWANSEVAQVIGVLSSRHCMVCGLLLWLGWSGLGIETDDGGILGNKDK